MTTAVFYERRRETLSIDFKDRRINQRRKQEAPISREQRRQIKASLQEALSRDRSGVNFELTEEQKALQETVRKFTQKEIVPVAAYYDQTGEFPWGVVKRAFELGIFISYIPEKYGGGGMGTFETALITEELGAGCMAMGTSIMVNLLGVSPLLIAGTEEQKTKYLIPYCRQLTLFSFCFTEPDAGSDPSRIGTTARLDRDHYILQGSKCFITNGGVADYFVVFATLDKSLGTKGLTAFLTPSNAEGIRIGKALDKMGQRASNTAEIFFENVKIPKENRIGEEGEGYKIALLSISRSRINVAAGGVGIARTAMEHALRYVQRRVQFNQPLADFQYVRFRLADMASLIDAARLLTWRAAWVHDLGRRYAKESSMAKDFAGDVVMKVTSEALDLLGGYGYSKEYPMEKLMRDAKLMQIYEGPSPIHKTIVYRELAKEYGF
jgi:acyl-CoA dehydrogenase